MANHKRTPLSVKPKPTTRSSPGVSRELADMVRRMADWNPQSDAAVLEAANRLAQAAREKLTPDAETACGMHVSEAMTLCSKLKGHTITRFNGIGEDHDLVLGVSAGKGSACIELKTVHAFKRNRIAEWAVSVRTVYVPVADVLSGMPTVKSRRRSGKNCPVPGYSLDTPGAAESIEQLRETLGIVSNALSRTRKKR